MLRNALLLIAAGALAAVALAQQPARPPFATTKVEGTDNVYIFRNGNHQAMFIVTDEGVIATDPVAYGRPTGGQTCVWSNSRTRTRCCPTRRCPTAGAPSSSATRSSS